MVGGGGPPKSPKMAWGAPHRWQNRRGAPLAKSRALRCYRCFADPFVSKLRKRVLSPSAERCARLVTLKDRDLSNGSHGRLSHTGSEVLSWVATTQQVTWGAACLAPQGPSQLYQHIHSNNLLKPLGLAPPPISRVAGPPPRHRRGPLGPSAGSWGPASSGGPQLMPPVMSRCRPNSPSFCLDEP